MEIYHKMMCDFPRCLFPVVKKDPKDPTRGWCSTHKNFPTVEEELLDLPPISRKTTLAKLEEIMEKLSEIHEDPVATKARFANSGLCFLVLEGILREIARRKHERAYG